MRKLRSIIAAITVLQLLMSCNDAKTTSDNTVLVHTTFDLSKISNDFSEAVEKKYDIQKKIEDIGAEFKIDFTTLEKDSLNSVLKDVSVVLLKGAKGYEFTAQSPEEQTKHGKTDMLKTSVTINVSYYHENIGNQTTTSKIFNIQSDGQVKEL